LARFDVADVGVLLITDGYDDTTVDRVQAALSVLPPGFAAVQLRAKTLSARDLVVAGRALRDVTRERALLVVNDRVDVAVAVWADAVHVPANGLSVAAARRAGPSLLVGVSTHSLDEVRAAAGADYVAFGPVWPTPSKAAYGAPVGVDTLRRAVTVAAMPVFALGGVDLSRLAEVAGAGARPAGIRSCLGQPSLAAVAAAAADLYVACKNGPRIA